mmetsp:Transcript_11331/g.19090  ORF Transcript_11331/g.19090 Transcript_11331/m.19090 type:complete len:119 (+) Transcript_11331:760-1116(+)
MEYHCFVQCPKFQVGCHKCELPILANTPDGSFEGHRCFDSLKKRVRELDDENKDIKRELDRLKKRDDEDLCIGFSIILSFILSIVLLTFYTTKKIYSLEAPPPCFSSQEEDFALPPTP